MAQIKPFTAVHYAPSPELDFSSVIAPPYDVLDESRKLALQAGHPNNIVTIDLPFTPPKSVGPDQVYEKANITLQSWLKAGILKRDARPSLYPYTQTFQQGGRTFHRRGLIALVRLSPFGQGEVVPHEKTYPGPIEDRLKLMQATECQLSPIFGLFNDPRNEVTGLLYRGLGKPALSGTLDHVQNDLWIVNDAAIENAVIDAMKNKPIYIADGHHRYTTALAHQKELAEKNGGSLPPNHPANWCMFVLVAMQDPGLLILPTHRLIGGLRGFGIDSLKKALAGVFDVVPAPAGGDDPEILARQLASEPAHTFGLYDGAARKSYLLRCKQPDPLAKITPDKSEAWRSLDVAILQHYLLEKAIAPTFSPGADPKRGYTAVAREVGRLTDGKEYHIALLLKPTPLNALVELGKHNEVMPQKSTYFYPKLATGMTIQMLRG